MAVVIASDGDDFRLRPYAVYDLPGVYRVCADVDAQGFADAPALGVPDLAGHVFAGPFLLADPTLGWVVVDECGVAGYVVATDDSEAFGQWRETHWYPALRAQHPLRVAPADGTADQRYLRFLHAPPRTIGSDLAAYPAELHIKLDRRAAGRGWGGRLVGALLEALRERAVPGVHLVVAERNAAARAFYGHLGFRTLRQDDGSHTMIKDLS